MVDITSLDRLYSAWQRTLRQGVRTATTPSVPGALRAAFPDRAPGRVGARRGVARDGLDRLGARSAGRAARASTRSASPARCDDLYEIHDLLPGSIVNAALAALSLG